MEDFNALQKKLEAEELDAPGGVAQPSVYLHLLPLYLLNNDLTNAKFLWKRISACVKSSHSELAQIWEVGQKLWQRDLPGVYQALDKEWSETVQPIMTALLESTRSRAFDLVGRAYASISAEDLSAFVGLPVVEAVEGAVSRGWSADAQTRFVKPKPAERPTGKPMPNEKQLSRLTDFVSFLEN